MDGALLVFDSRSLPHLHALAPVDVPVPVAPKAQWRHRTFSTMAALLLATVLSLVYFVSTQSGTAPPAPVNVPSVTLPASNLDAPAQTNPTPEPPPATQESGAAPTTKAAPATKEETKPVTPVTQPAKKAAAKTSTSITQPKPAQETKKDDSKVGSILKKTGRILKKPFKF
ncbi:MAG TPA: hypothetical protein VJS13_14855 [Pyrinomonadaceae bacterium]|nr:hypothetical protein [Pyrinomonadaceae bacterium]